MFLMVGVVGLILGGWYFYTQNETEEPVVTEVAEDAEGPRGTFLEGPNGEVGFEVEPVTYKKPPQEAIDACTGRKEEASCSVVAPNGTLPGKCLTTGAYFSCVPN